MSRRGADGEMRWDPALGALARRSARTCVGHGCIRARLTGIRSRRTMKCMEGRRRTRPHACGAPTEDGTPCQRHLTIERWCQEHPEGEPSRPPYVAIRYRYTSTPANRRVPVPDRAPPPRRDVRTQAQAQAQSQPPQSQAQSQLPQLPPKQQRLVRRVELPEAKTAKTAVGLVNELATDGWRRAAVDRLSDYLGDEAGSVLDQSWKAGHCKKIAKAARNLARLGGQFAALDGVLASQSARQAVSGSEVGTVLLARAIMLHSPTDVEVIARGLRVSGITLCVLNGCLGSCQCLRDLCEDAELSRVQELVDQALDQFFVGTSSAAAVRAQPAPA